MWNSFSLFILMGTFHTQSRQPVEGKQLWIRMPSHSLLTLSYLLTFYLVEKASSFLLALCYPILAPLLVFYPSRGPTHVYEIEFYSNTKILPSVQFSSVVQSCLTLCDPMNSSTPGHPVHHQLPEIIQTHLHRVSDAIQPSHPRSSPSPPAPNPSQHQSLFQ